MNTPFLFSLKLIVPLLFPGCLLAQSYLEGRVVELSGGKETGVANTTVSIVDFSWDITDDRGFFKLPLPPARDHVTLALEQSPLKLLSPYEGLVNLPPESPFRVIVCGEENRRLQRQVADLNTRVARLQKDKQFNARQLAGMHKILLDTILHYEQRIGLLGDRSRQTDQDGRIRALEDSLNVLVKALGVALETKFLRQKEAYDRIAAGLHDYVDRLKDLRDRATPAQLPLFFRSAAASDELNRGIGRYNAARELILEQQAGNVLAARQYWDTAAAADQLEAVYAFLLNRVHREHILPLDDRVFGEIRRYEAKQTGRPRAEKTARRNAESLLPALDADIRTLETKIAAALEALAQNK